jgi:hypothetical protein
LRVFAGVTFWGVALMLLQVFAGRHLVLEASQVMSGIPYADTFT